MQHEKKIGIKKKKIKFSDKEDLQLTELVSIYENDCVNYNECKFLNKKRNEV